MCYACQITSRGSEPMAMIHQLPRLSTASDAMSASTKSRPKVATDSDKALPDAPIMLTPLRKHAPSPFFPGRQLAFTTQPPAPPTHGRLRWVLLLPALLVGLLVFVLATILLLYFFVLRRVPGAAVAPVILVAEPTHGLLGLTISTLATHTASIGAPVLVSVAGYCVAGTWLKEQAFPRQTRVALPTPLQYIRAHGTAPRHRPPHLSIPSKPVPALPPYARPARLPRRPRAHGPRPWAVLYPHPRRRVAARGVLRRRRSRTLPARARPRVPRPPLRVRPHRGRDISLAARAPRTRPELAHRRLVDPLALIGAL
ncbi:hypothetical protein B0H17DRAFT_1075690 [Mycena rosella]|uniref:Uncharacterized protein n=1 Tax=Mycena rosella TaxID=1033263 RepID=A0AAD7GEN6_MYCRO|nr:hypothetical protein B0H17DRAFT_1075690 [Mycena rosella]